MAERLKKEVLEKSKCVDVVAGPGEYAYFSLYKMLFRSGMATLANALNSLCFIRVSVSICSLKVEWHRHF